MKRPFDQNDLAQDLRKMNLFEDGRERKSLVENYRFGDAEIFDDAKVLGQIFESLKILRKKQQIGGAFVLLSTFRMSAVYWLRDSGEMAKARTLSELGEAKLVAQADASCVCKKSVLEVLDSFDRSKQGVHLAGCREGIVDERVLCQSKIYHYQSEDYVWFIASVVGKMVHSEQLPVSETARRCMVESGTESIAWRLHDISKFLSGMSSDSNFKLFHKKLNSGRFVTLSWITERVCLMSPRSQPSIFVCKKWTFDETKSIEYVENETLKMAKYEQTIWKRAYGDDTARVLRIGGKTVLGMIQCESATRAKIAAHSREIVNEIRRFAEMGLVHHRLTEDHIAFAGSRPTFLSLGHVQQVSPEITMVHVETFVQIMMQYLNL